MAVSATGGYAQEVVNGQVVDTKKSDESSKKSNSMMNQMDFINMLVAEMKYQDPLEPSSNTDYVAQMATFSQVQALEDMKDSMSNMNATNLVGKYVSIVSEDAAGRVSEVVGKVDYVTIENGKTYVSVEDQKFSVDDVVSVMDDDYSDANVLAASFNDYVSALPDVLYVTAQDAQDISDARTVYEAMSAYARQFVDKDLYAKLESLEQQALLHGWGDYGVGGRYYVPTQTTAEETAASGTTDAAAASGAAASTDEQTAASTGTAQTEEEDTESSSDADDTSGE